MKELSTVLLLAIEDTLKTATLSRLNELKGKSAPSFHPHTSGARKRIFSMTVSPGRARCATKPCCWKAILPKWRGKLSAR